MNATTQHLAADTAAPSFFGDAFPTADMLHAAAALFPTEGRRQEVGFARVGHDLFPETAREFAEGSWPELTIAPGLVRLRRRDAGAGDRARTRSLAAREALARQQRALEYAQLHAPMVWAPDHGKLVIPGEDESTRRRRGSVTAWSSRSQMRLIQAVLSLDLHPLVSGTRTPVMVTLTLPDKWLDVAPDAQTIADKFDAFRRKWADRWGAPSWIWKREFQLRGAPHFHLWTVPPIDDLAAFRAELLRMWADSLGITDPRDDALSRIHGVDVSRADGMRARDPRRLAFYFLKESGTSARKAYQNQPPREWEEHESVGRYWGVRGISRATVTVTLDPADYEKVYDRVAQLRGEATGLVRQDGDLVNVRTGVVNPDPMAGWVAVPSGSDLAVELAALLLKPDPGDP